MITFIRDSLTLRRVEYRVAEIPIFAIPLLLEARGPMPVATVLQAFVVFGFMLAFGDLANCYFDRDLDAKYKPALSQAVYRLGLRGVCLQMAFSAAGALLVAAHLALQLHRPGLLLLAAVGLALAWIYSAPPVRMKGRGLGQLAWYWGGLFFGPMIFAALLLSPWPGLGTLLVAAAFATAQSGILLVNNAEDLPEDREAEVHTVTVALGIPAAMRLAAWMTGVGGAGLVLSLYALYVYRGVPLHESLLPLVGAVAWTALGVRRLGRQVDGVPEDRAVTLVREAGRRVPLWITGVAVTAMLAAWWLRILG